MAYPAITVLNYVVTTPLLGAQPIMQPSTTQNHPIGTIVRAVDVGTAQLGEGEFIYLKGIGSVAAGSVVSYDQSVPSCELLVDDGRIGQIAVAMAAVVASNYGWFQISGAAVAKYLTNAAINLQAYVTATPGSISSDIVTGDVITGANFKTAVDLAGTKTAAGFTTVQLSRPSVALV
jgi:hypothetical protein